MWASYRLLDMPKGVLVKLNMFFILFPNLNLLYCVTTVYDSVLTNLGGGMAFWSCGAKSGFRAKTASNSIWKGRKILISAEISITTNTYVNPLSVVTVAKQTSLLHITSVSASHTQSYNYGNYSPLYKCITVVQINFKFDPKRGGDYII